MTPEEIRKRIKITEIVEGNSIPNLHPHQLDNLHLELKITRKSHYKLKSHQCEKHVEEVLHRFLKSLTELTGAKLDFEEFCAGGPLNKTIRFSHQSPIYDKEAYLDDSILKDDCNDQPRTDNLSLNH